jgi:hypothetical protein
MGFQASRLRRGELLAGAAGAALLAVMFLGWYRFPVSSTGAVKVGLQSRDAWNSFTVLDVLLAITIAVAFALVWFQATRRSPAIPVSLSVIVTVLAPLSALAVLFRALDAPGGATTTLAAPYLAVVCALGMFYGGYLSMRQEGRAPQDARTDIETVPLRTRSH